LGSALHAASSDGHPGTSEHTYSPDKEHTFEAEQENPASQVAA